MIIHQIYILLILIFSLHSIVCVNEQKNDANQENQLNPVQIIEIDKEVDAYRMNIDMDCVTEIVRSGSYSCPPVPKIRKTECESCGEDTTEEEGKVQEELKRIRNEDVTSCKKLVGKYIEYTNPNDNHDSGVVKACHERVITVIYEVHRLDGTIDFRHPGRLSTLHTRASNLFHELKICEHKVRIMEQNELLVPHDHDYQKPCEHEEMIRRLQFQIHNLNQYIKAIQSKEKKAETELMLKLRLQIIQLNNRYNAIKLKAKPCRQNQVIKDLRNELELLKASIPPTSTQPMQINNELTPINELFVDINKLEEDNYHLQDMIDKGFQREIKKQNDEIAALKLSVDKLSSDNAKLRSNLLPESDAKYLHTASTIAQKLVQNFTARDLEDRAKDGYKTAGFSFQIEPVSIPKDKSGKLNNKKSEELLSLINNFDQYDEQPAISLLNSMMRRFWYPGVDRLVYVLLNGTLLSNPSDTLLSTFVDAFIYIGETQDIVTRFNQHLNPVVSYLYDKYNENPNEAEEEEDNKNEDEDKKKKKVQIKDKKLIEITTSGQSILAIVFPYHFCTTGSKIIEDTLIKAVGFQHVSNGVRGEDESYYEQHERPVVGTFIVKDLFETFQNYEG